VFPSGRSRGVTVAIDGFFAFAGFGWGQTDAPSWLVIPLAVGTALAVALAVTGVMVTRRSADGLASAVAPGTATGPGAGLSLLGFGLATLLIGPRRRGSLGV
jgi:hypothetical protein